MIDKLKKLVAISLSSVVGFSGLISATEVPTASQQPVTLVQNQQLPAINLQVVNQESSITKALSAVKLAFVGTATVGLGACCYKVYNIANNVDKKVGNILDIVESGVRDASDTFKKFIESLPEDKAQKLVDDIDKILENCGTTIGTANELLKRIEIEKFNGLGPASVALINSLTKSIQEIFTVDPANGNTNIVEIFKLLCKKNK